MKSKDFKGKKNFNLENWDYNKFIDLMLVHLSGIELEKAANYECNVRLDSVVSNDDYKVLVRISLKDLSENNESYLFFTYNVTKNMIDNVRATLRGEFSKKSHVFLKSLEDFAKELNCREMRTLSDESFWEETDWLRFPDGTYRKNLACYLN